MEINRAAFGALAVIGIVAAGGGAYLANRHNEAELAQPAPMYAVPSSRGRHRNRKHHHERARSGRRTRATADCARTGSTSRLARAARRAPAPCAHRRPPRNARARHRLTAATAARPRRLPRRPHARVDPPISPAIEPVENTTRRTRAGRARTAAEDVRRAGYSCRLRHRAAGRKRREHRAGEDRR